MSTPAPAPDTALADHPASLVTKIVQWFGASRTGLPTRVLRELDREQHQAEILIGWTQAALILVFAVLYAVSRKTAPPDAFQPVPWALAVYATVTAVRLTIAHRGHLTRMHRAVSVVFDVAWLMVTIWSFHIQYGQPAAFYLKAPTLLYVFIFIALRTLSFSPSYVLYAGAVSALGWLALLLYALSSEGGMRLVTQDYVAYMNSASILIGGEIDKIISILLVSLLLAVAVARSRALLRRAVAEQAASLQLARFLPREVAETLVSANELLRPGEGEERRAATMFIDLRGFTELSATLSPRDLIATLGEYQRIVVPIVHAHRGVITTFLGDGVMVTFGALRQTTTYAADALRCTEALIAAFEDWRSERAERGQAGLTVGIGVDSGTVICGAIGDEDRLEYAVLGNPVNRAAKLESHTRKEKVPALTTVGTQELAVKQGYVATRECSIQRGSLAEGLADPVDLVAVR